MSDQMDLEGVIEDSVNDATAPDTDTSYTETTDTTDGVADTTAVETATEEVVETSSQAPVPGASAEAPVEDEFGKRFGLQPNSITGRENRIPYSRVKKIVEKAEKEALAKAQQQFAATPQPKVAEYETKIKDYEGRLQNVAQFEHMIEHQPKEFLNFLSSLPAYKEFFTYLEQLAQQTAAPAKEEPYFDTSTMPQPDEQLADGSMVYSLKGLAARDEWVARQVEARAIKAAEDRIAQRYAPIEQQWQQEQRRQQAIPIIQKQIAEARQWPGFVDAEAEIIEVLKADPNISLDGAYRKVVVPKIQAQVAAAQPDRDKMRQEILEELRKKPTSTAAPTSQVKPTAPAAGKRSLEDIIQEAANSLKR